MTYVDGSLAGYGAVVQGTRDVVTSSDGTSIGLLTAGSGPPLLLVHGGLSGMARWAPLWETLVPHMQVTAMDRRGRGASGDGPAYDAAREFEDVRAVLEVLAARTGGPVDVLGHSFGAACVLGAAGLGTPVRRLALVEPPGPQTVPAPWLDRVSALLGAGQPGPAVVSFLVDVVGLTPAEVDALRESSGGGDDVLAVASRTLVREARAIVGLDLGAMARAVTQPLLLLLGTRSPQWAGQTTREVLAQAPQARLVMLPGQGHEVVNTAPELLTAELLRFMQQGTA